VNISEATLEALLIRLPADVAMTQFCCGTLSCSGGACQCNLPFEAHLGVSEPAGEALEVDDRPAAVRRHLPAARVQLHQLTCVGWLQNGQTHLSIADTLSPYLQAEPDPAQVSAIIIIV